MTDDKMNHFLTLSLVEFEKSVKNIDLKKIDEAKDIIIDAEKNGGRVHVTGIGKPSHLAHYGASLLSSTGTPSYFLDATEAVHGSAGQVNSSDVVIAISNSGETKELKATIFLLKKNGAKIISITRSCESWLAKESIVTLIAKADKEGDDLNKAPRSSILAETLVLQCLSVALQYERNLDLSQYLMWHPGGSLGSSIRSTLMKEGEK